MLGKNKVEVASMISKYINDQFTNGSEEQQTFIKWCCRVLRGWKPDQTMQQAVQHTIKASKVLSHTYETLDIGVQCNLNEGVHVDKSYEYQTRDDYLDMEIDRSCEQNLEKQKPASLQQNKIAPIKGRKKKGEDLALNDRKESQARDLEDVKQGSGLQGEDVDERLIHMQGDCGEECVAYKEPYSQFRMELQVTQEKEPTLQLSKIVIKRKETVSTNQDEQQKDGSLVQEHVGNGFESSFHVDNRNQTDKGLVDGCVSEPKSFHQMDFIDMSMV
eukprot:TRINITY_DN53213_c0_g1_i2.p1 TRINITY_DN53213_c0_g1~~TRINITY_DN53213_c0_g1_i2.p1  ORF type:complete len:297 (+),score=32.15 TRINITY_DN53213_c0_g1_i2:71-892(+)